MTTTLSEVQSKGRVVEYGLPVLDERTADDPAGAVVAAFSALGRYLEAL